jgi:hypothetical protein
MRAATVMVWSWHAVNLVLLVWTVWAWRADRGASVTVSTAMALDGAPWVNMIGLVAWLLSLITLGLPVVLRGQHQSP